MSKFCALALFFCFLKYKRAITQTRATRARTAIAIPAVAPADRPLLEELEDTAELDVAAASGATALLLLSEIDEMVDTATKELLSSVARLTVANGVLNAEEVWL